MIAYILFFFFSYEKASYLLLELGKKLFGRVILFLVIFFSLLFSLLFLSPLLFYITLVPFFSFLFAGCERALA